MLGIPDQKPLARRFCLSKLFECERGTFIQPASLKVSAMRAADLCDVWNDHAWLASASSGMVLGRLSDGNPHARDQCVATSAATRDRQLQKCLAFASPPEKRDGQ